MEESTLPAELAVQLAPRIEPRGWDWIFRVLWHSAGPFKGQDESAMSSKGLSSPKKTEQRSLFARKKLPHGPSATESSPQGIHLRIPETVLLLDGSPDLWLRTGEDGRVERVAYPESTRTTAKPILSKLMLVKAAFERRLAGRMAHSDQKGKREEGPLCLAWYRDGRKEILSLSSFSKLMGHHEWRVQVVGLQEYLPHVESRLGLYDEANSKISHEGENLMYHSMARTLAQFISLSPYVKEEESNQRASIRVTLLRAEFLVDASSLFSLSHCQELWVQVIPRVDDSDPEVARILQETQARAQGITSELYDLLTLAARRGAALGPESSFRHFDKRGSGLVGPEELALALKELNISATSLICKLVIQNIAGPGASQFTANDLVNFMASYAGPTREKKENKEQKPKKQKAQDAGPASNPTEDSRSSLNAVRQAARVELTSSDPTANPGFPHERPSTSYSIRAEDPLGPWASDVVRENLSELVELQRKRNELKQKEKIEAKEVTGSDQSGAREEKADHDEKEGESEFGQFTTGTEGKTILKEETAAQEKDIEEERINEEYTDDLDSPFLQLDEQTIVRYQIWKCSPREQEADEGKDHTLEVLAARQSAVRRHVSEEHWATPFMLILLPDLFQTLKSLEEPVQALLSRFSSVKILAMALPGLPGTRWKKNKLLTSDFHCECLSALLSTLQAQGQWIPQPARGRGAVPHIIMGLGSGGHLALRFVSSYLSRPEHLSLAGSLLGVTVINGFKDPLAFGLKKGFRRLRKAFEESSKSLKDKQGGKERTKASSSALNELLQLYISIAFSQDYVNNQGPQAISKELLSVQEFWRTRKGLEAVAALLKGFEQSTPLPDLLPDVTMPLFIVHGTEESLVSPEHGKSCLTGNRRAVDSLLAAIEKKEDYDGNPLPPALHFSWLKGGHELLRENKAFFCQYLDHLLLAYKELRNKEQEDGEEEVQNRLGGRETDNTDRLSTTENQLSSNVHKKRDAPDSLLKKTSRYKASIPSASSPKAVKDSSFSTDGPPLSTATSITVEGGLIGPTPKERQEAREKEEEQKRIEKNIRATKERERKKQNAIQEQKALAEEARKRFHLEEEKTREQMERAVMQDEDSLSRQYSRQLAECDEWQKKSEIVLETVKEMQSARAREAAKEEETRQLRERSLQAERRREKIDAMKKEAEEKAREVSSNWTQYGISPDSSADALSEGVDKLIQDVLEVRANKKRGIVVQREAEQKYAAANNSVEETDTKLRTVRRTLRRLREELHEREAEKIKHAKALAMGKKLPSPDRTRGKKEVHFSKRDEEQLVQQEKELDLVLNDLLHLRSVAQLELDAENSAVQFLTMQEGGLLKAIEEIKRKVGRELELRKDKVLSLREEEDKFHLKRKETSLSLETSQARLLAVHEEGKRAKAWNRPFIDSSVYLDGVPQRIRTHDLMLHLTREETLLLEAVPQLKEELEAVEELIKETAVSISRVCKEGLVLHEADRALKDFQRKVLSRSVVQELEIEKANEAARAKEGSAELNAQIQRQLEEEGLPASLADVIRRKPSKQRTKEEKEWVALDVTINGSQYPVMTAEEMQDMKLDSAYDIKLSKEAVERILGLPAHVQLALPFLNSKEELRAHEILQKFTFGRDLQHFTEQDFLSAEADSGSSALGLKESYSLIAAENRVEDELRLRRGRRARTKRAVDRSEEEQYWVACDIVINPELYSSTASSLASTTSEAHPAMSSALPDRGSTPTTISSQNTKSKESRKGEEESFHSLEQRATSATRSGELDEAISGGEQELKVEDKAKEEGENHVAELFEPPPTGFYTCPFSRQVLMDLWHKAEGQLADEQEKFVFLLMKIFGGPREGQGNVNGLDPGLLSPSSSSSVASSRSVHRGMVVTELKEIPSVKEAYGASPIVCDGKLRTILEKKEEKINARETRAISFELPSDAGIILDLTVSVVFRGMLSSDGFEPGRLAAMLYKLPRLADGGGPGGNLYGRPIPIGYSPHDSVSLCTRETMGRIMIFHRPKSIPLSSGFLYQATPAEIVVREELKKALGCQAQLPVISRDLRDVLESIRLAERKLRLASESAFQADTEAKRCEKEREDCVRKLEKDDQQLQLPSSERMALIRKSQTLDHEFVSWCRRFTSRSNEVRDIKSGLNVLSAIQREKEREKEKREALLSSYRKTILPAIESLQGEAEALKAAYDLNTDYEPVRGSATLLLNVAGLQTAKLTPAEKLRRKFRHHYEEQEKALFSKEEKEWIGIDRKLYPEKYQWLEEVERRQKRRNRGTAKVGLATAQAQANDAGGIGVGHAFSSQLTQSEILRILESPWDSLERKEIRVRKLINLFPDSNRRKGAGKSTDEEEGEEYNSNLAPAVRGKLLQSCTAEERTFLSFDRLFHPERYRFMPPNLSQGSLPSAPYTRDELQLILFADLDNLDSETKEVQRILHKYYGKPSEESKRSYRLRQETQERMASVRKEGRNSQPDEEDGDDRPELVDIDARARELLRELDRALANTNEFMDSGVLHGSTQRFPTAILRLDLERELNKVLMQQILEREERQEARIKKEEAEAVPSDSDPEDQDEEAQLARKARHVEKMRAAQEGQAGRWRKIPNKLSMAMMSKLSPEEQERVRSLIRLGPGGCLACRSNPCKWQAPEDTEELRQRLAEVTQELERVKRLEERVIVSSVCMAAVRGGLPVTMSRQDLLDELVQEQKLIQSELKLQEVDKELHDAVNCLDKEFKTKALHGYEQIQSTANVTKALEREHNNIIANQLSTEIIEDILTWMLEGWYFGEKPSSAPVMGYVPSIKSDGPIRSRDFKTMKKKVEQDRRERERKRKELEILQNTSPQLLMLEKWMPIEVASQERVSKKKAVREGSDVDLSLKEVEQTLKFGLFSLTLMYFRALSLLRQQRELMSKEKGTLFVKKTMARHKQFTEERKKMMEERKRFEERQRNIRDAESKAAIGAQRKKAREERENQTKLQKIQERNRRMRRERVAVVKIQKVFRGHLGRKAAAKWKIVKKEIDARKALEYAASVAIQRVFRGYQGRKRAEETRLEIAEFIAAVRAEEAAEDEEFYWEMHALQKNVKDFKDFLRMSDVEAVKKAAIEKERERRMRLMTLRKS